MRQRPKREIYQAVDVAARTLTAASFTRRKAGYWAADRGRFYWAAGVVFVPEFGDGVFQLEWGVRVDEIDELVWGWQFADHSLEYRTAGGDLGALVRQRRSAERLASRSAQVDLLTRLIQRVRPQDNREISGLLDDWFHRFLELIEPVDSLPTLEAFLRNGVRRRFRGFEPRLLPDAPIFAAIRALEGDVDGASAILDRWQEVAFDKRSPGHQSNLKIAAEIRARIERQR